MMGEPTGNYRKVLHAGDVGTRLSHMVELHDLWNTCYGILTRPDLFHTPLEEERAKQLEVAITLLSHHMQAEYNEITLAQEINNIDYNPPMVVRPKKEHGTT